MAVVQRRYKVIGYDATQPANGISWGPIKDGNGDPVDLFMTATYDSDVTMEGDVDFLAAQQGLVYAP